MKTTITLAVIAMISMSLKVNAQSTSNGSFSVYSTESGKTDFRLTTNMIDADNAYLYNYSENAQTFHTVNIGGSRSLSSGLTVLGNGQVGIGTSTPNYTLVVMDGPSSTSGINIQGANSRIYFEGKRAIEGQLSYNRLDIGEGYDNTQFFGNVGIGTSAPNYTLVVKDGPSLTSGINVEGANSRIYFEGKRAMEGHLTHNRLDVGEGYDKTQFFGNVGIGTNSPGAKLHVVNQAQDSHGNTLILGPGGGAQLRLGYGTNYSWIQAHGSKPLRINELGNNTIVNLSGGLVGIGTSAPTQKLSVNGKINAEEIILEDVAGADFVFEEDYDLRSLEETEQFIQTNKHLPEIPSAAEMAEEGLEIKEMNILLLQKVEELTLHLIEQNKQNQSQEERITHLEKEIEALKNKKP